MSEQTSDPEPDEMNEEEPEEADGDEEETGEERGAFDHF